MTDLLTTHDLQTVLHVDRTTIYRMVESGQLPAIRVGKQWRFVRGEIERWLENAKLTGRPAGDTAKATPALASSLGGLEPFPVACIQMIQDAFADLLGVMIIVTDMEGRPITRFSNSCGFYRTLVKDAETLGYCTRGWQQLAADPAIAPRFLPSEMGLLCARGLIRVGSELKGMVVLGGIAPDPWPPAADQLAQLADQFGLSVAEVAAHVEEVYRLDKAGQERVLQFVQRIADIFSHIVSDRSTLCGRLQAIASLTAL